MSISRRTTILITSLSFLFLIVTQVSAASMDISSWTAVDLERNVNTTAGIWTLDDGGTGVTQKSGNKFSMSMFINGADVIGYTITGTMEVQTGGDNDMIGLIFGVQDYGTGSDYNYLVIDWKQSKQDDALEGFYLYSINGYADGANIWAHSGDSLTVLASHIGDYGWADNTEYTYELTYTETQIIFKIDGSEIFNISGTFSAGEFGFYNYSQDEAHYTLDSYTSSVPVPATIVSFGIGLLSLAGFTRKKQRTN